MSWVDYTPHALAAAKGEIQGGIAAAVEDVRTGDDTYAVIDLDVGAILRAAFGELDLHGSGSFPPATHATTHGPGGADEIFKPYRAASGSGAILATDGIVKATAAGITLTLPTAVGIVGRIYIVDNASSGDITVDTTGGETVWDESSQTIPQNSCVSFYSDGANWRIC